MQEEQEQDAPEVSPTVVKKTGWRGPPGSINKHGRPKKSIKANAVKTNRERRQEELMSALRKFKPHVSKAVTVAAEILVQKDSSESGKLRSAALILGLYKDLTNMVYDPKFDEETGNAEAVQESGVMFSLSVVGDESAGKQKRKG